MIIHKEFDHFLFPKIIQNYLETSLPFLPKNNQFSNILIYSIAYIFNQILQKNAVKSQQNSQSSLEKKYKNLFNNFEKQEQIQTDFEKTLKTILQKKKTTPKQTRNLPYQSEPVSPKNFNNPLPTNINVNLNLNIPNSPKKDKNTQKKSKETSIPNLELKNNNKIGKDIQKQRRKSSIKKHFQDIQTQDISINIENQKLSRQNFSKNKEKSQKYTENQPIFNKMQKEIDYLRQKLNEYKQKYAQEIKNRHKKEKKLLKQCMEEKQSLFMKIISLKQQLNKIMEIDFVDTPKMYPSGISKTQAPSRQSSILSFSQKSDDLQEDHKLFYNNNYVKMYTDELNLELSSKKEDPFKKIREKQQNSSKSQNNNNKIQQSYQKQQQQL